MASSFVRLLPRLGCRLRVAPRAAAGQGCCALSPATPLRGDCFARGGGRLYCQQGARRCASERRAAAACAIAEPSLEERLSTQLCREPQVRAVAAARRPGSPRGSLAQRHAL